MSSLPTLIAPPLEFKDIALAESKSKVDDVAEIPAICKVPKVPETTSLLFVTVVIIEN